jgi:hypothetical protein
MRKIPKMMMMMKTRIRIQILLMICSKTKVVKLALSIMTQWMKDLKILSKNIISNNKNWEKIIINLTRLKVYFYLEKESQKSASLCNYS